MPSEIVLVEYDKACRALERAVYVDEAKAIRDEALSLQAYAKQAKNKKLEANAWRVRIRAERRIGEMMENGKADRAGVGQRKGSEKTLSKPTLPEIGIDKSLANRARRLAELDKGVFDKFVVDGAAQTQRHAEVVVVTNSKPKRNKPKPAREYECPHCGKPVYLKAGRLEK